MEVKPLCGIPISHSSIMVRETNHCINNRDTLTPLINVKSQEKGKESSALERTIIGDVAQWVSNI